MRCSWRRLCRFIVVFTLLEAFSVWNNNNQPTSLLCIWFRMMIMIVPISTSKRCCMLISAKFTICRKKREIWFCRTRIVRKSYVSTMAAVCQWTNVQSPKPVEFVRQSKYQFIFVVGSMYTGTPLCTLGECNFNRARRLQLTELTMTIDLLLVGFYRSLATLSADICELAFH